MKNETSFCELNSILETIEVKRVQRGNVVPACEAFFRYGACAQTGTPKMMLGPLQVGKSDVAKALTRTFGANLRKSKDV